MKRLNMRQMSAVIYGSLFFFTVSPLCLYAQVSSFPWPTTASDDSVEARFQPPSGFKRVHASEDSLTAWLRKLPLKPGRPLVRLHNGDLKGNQRAHAAVIDMDAGTRDLQQCADAVIRLHAEYLFQSGDHDALTFTLTNGQQTSWTRWREGWRGILKNNRFTWKQVAQFADSYASFRRWLNFVFAYAGTYSLGLDMKSVDKPRDIQAGDVFLQAGFPGHAVIVMDVAQDERGNRMFLLAQSYMPAQDIHILRGPSGSESPWYAAKDRGLLQTPEWTFDYTDLRRFTGQNDLLP